MGRTVIDVREPDEFSAGHYKGAINIPLSTIPDNPKLKEIDKDATVVCYCRSGGRSQSAIQILKSHGFTNLSNGINQATIERGDE